MSSLGNFVNAVRERREKYGIHRGFFKYFPDAYTSCRPAGQDFRRKANRFGTEWHTSTVPVRRQAFPRHVLSEVAPESVVPRNRPANFPLPQIPRPVLSVDLQRRDRIR